MPRQGMSTAAVQPLCQRRGASTRASAKKTVLPCPRFEHPKVPQSCKIGFAPIKTSKREELGPKVSQLRACYAPLGLDRCEQRLAEEIDSLKARSVLMMVRAASKAEAMRNSIAPSNGRAMKSTSTGKLVCVGPAKRVPPSASRAHRRCRSRSRWLEIGFCRSIEPPRPSAV